MEKEEIQNGNISESKAVIHPIINTSMPTLGRHLTQRLVQIGVTDVFSVPGDFNLTLLDYFVAQPGLNLIGCCNELNCGYATDGYARSRGIGACVVTFTVGGLSIINAIAGAYSADLPIICIVGGQPSKEYGTKRILHHTIGLPDFTQELKCYQAVTCHQAIIDDLEEAQEEIDKAIAICLKESKPVYVSVSCDLVAIPHPNFNQTSTPLFLPPKMSDEMVLEAAVEATAVFLKDAVKPVLVGGPKLQVAKACDAFIELADACGYVVAVMASAKGLVPENHPQFIGVYWGVASSFYCKEIVDIADASLFAGPSFDETNTVGFTLMFKRDKAVVVEPERVLIPNRPAFRCILMKDFLKALAKRLDRNTTAFENYKRIYVPEGEPVKCEPKEDLKVNILFKHVQNLLSGEMAVIAEAGDSWFHCQKLKLPQDCGFQCQLLYASIGWSVGATLGYAQAAQDKRVIACIGDGSFQMTAQEVSTMLRLEQKSIIILINNGGYTIEVVIHDGPYNVIKNWNYTSLVEALDNGEGKCWTAKVRCEEELVAAIEMAMGDKKDCLCFIEVIVHKDDTSKGLIEFGCKVSRQSMSK